MSNKGSALVTNPVLENGGIGNQTTGHYHVGTLDINYHVGHWTYRIITWDQLQLMY